MGKKKLLLVVRIGDYLLFFGDVSHLKTAMYNVITKEAKK